MEVLCLHFRYLNLHEPLDAFNHLHFAMAFNELIKAVRLVNQDVKCIGHMVSEWMLSVCQTLYLLRDNQHWYKARRDKFCNYIKIGALCPHSG